MKARVAAGRLSPLLDLHPPVASLGADVRRGLAARPRKLSPKWFYDDAGALLFERIMQLEEYYPTRTELVILQRHAAELATLIGPRARVVEFGSGSGAKTKVVLERLQEPASYLPIDISRRQLLAFADSVSAAFPGLEVLPVCADYTGEVRLPASDARPARTVAFFPGSTIGNFELPGAERFLRRVAKLCGAGGQLLVGTDLHKDRTVLEQAYNDAAGITAAFNLNLLARINRECGANFDLAGFRHRAWYDDAQRRIEMRLVSIRSQAVMLPPGGGMRAARFEFGAGDHIITEYSHKYTTSAFAQLAARTGWRVERVWTDERHWFATWLLARR